jgi:glycosyltransferase involved in cell wall biosynthesis
VYNERAFIEEVLLRVQASPIDKEIVLVDDKSTDGTRALLEELDRTQAEGGREAIVHNGKARLPLENIRFLFQPQNAGKGAALRRGFEAATGDIVLVQDADLEYDPRDYGKLLEPIFDGRADVVYGSRFLGGPQRVHYFWHYAGNKFLTLLSDIFTNLKLTDMETCYKVFRREVLQGIKLESDRFGFEPEVTAKIAKGNWRIYEVPISYAGRTYAEGKKISWKDGVRALWAIFRYSLSDRIYAADGHGGEILLRLNRAPRFTGWMADAIRPYVGNRVLEIGAGIGNMTMHLLPRTVYWATDINPAYLDSLERLKINRPYLHVARVDGTDGSSFPTGESFDTVICLNVVEHLSDDHEALRNIWNVVEPGGRAIVLVPNGPKLFGTLDEVLGHCRRYTEDQLIHAGEAAGFRAEKLLKFNRPGVPAWWLNGQVLRRTTFGLGQIRVLNFLTPLFRVIDPWLPLPPLSLIAIFRKENGAAPEPSFDRQFVSSPNPEV